MPEKMGTIREEEVVVSRSGRGGKTLWIILGVIVIAGAIWWSGALNTITGASGYQAVFLSNNQVYFGMLSNRMSQYPVLSDVYYLQVTQTLQPRDKDAPANNVNLVKLGGELHGPQDNMVINRDQIIFFEDLRDDSQVVKAIKDYQAKQAQ